jgi:hypothetical protein
MVSASLSLITTQYVERLPRITTLSALCTATTGNHVGNSDKKISHTRQFPLNLPGIGKFKNITRPHYKSPAKPWLFAYLFLFLFLLFLLLCRYFALLSPCCSFTLSRSRALSCCLSLSHSLAQWTLRPQMLGKPRLFSTMLLLVMRWTMCVRCWSKTLIQTLWTRYDTDLCAGRLFDLADQHTSASLLLPALLLHTS